MKKRIYFLLAILVFFLALASGAGTAGAQAWQRLGPPGGNVISMASAGSSSLYLGMADGHIFASDDGARHWELRGRVDQRTDGVVQRLLVDVHFPGRIFAAVWYQDPAAGGGLFRSEDAGRTWSSAGLEGEAVRVIEQSPSAPDTFLAGTRNGVFRSRDHGRSWQRITPGGDPELRNIDSLAIDPRDAQVIYAGTYHLPWKTVDGGQHWTAVTAGMIDDSDVMSLRVDAREPERVFASACSGIYRSDNGGAQWTKLQGIPYSSRRTQVLVQDPDNSAIIYAGTTEGLWVARDGGENWVRASPREWVVNGVAFAEGAAAGVGRRVVLATEEQGIVASDDAVATFVTANTGFAHRVVADLLGDLQSSGHLLARVPGTANEILETRNAGKTWTPLAGEAPRGIRKLVEAGNEWWALLEDGGLARYDRNGKLWQKWKFLGTQSVRVSSPNANSAKRVRKVTEEASVQVRELRVAAGQMYAASDRGLWTGSLAEKVVRPFAEKFVVGNVRSMDVSADGAELWVVMADSLWRSSDGGLTWRRAPAQVPAAALWIRSGAIPGALFVGTEQGTYLSRTAGQSWQLLQSGLPATSANPPFTLPDSLAVSLKMGGLYVSRDGGRSWQRMDTAREAGAFTGVWTDERGGWFAGSRTEGVLHWGSSNLN